MQFKEAEQLKEILTKFIDVLPQISELAELKNPTKGLITDVAALIYPQHRVQYVDADTLSFDPQDEDARKDQEESKNTAPDETIVSLIGQISKGVQTRTVQLRQTADVLNQQI